MLPYFLISNSGNSVLSAAKEFMLLSGTADCNLLNIESNGFNIALLPAPDNHYFAKENSALIVCGFIRHPEFVWDWKGTNQTFFEQLLADLASKNAEQIKEAYTGNYTIFYLANNSLQIFNTLSGLQPVYYHNNNGATTICSNIICMQSIVKEHVRDAGVLQITLNEWTETYTRATILSNVNRIVSNEHITFSLSGDFEKRIIPFVVNYKGENVPVMECVSSVWEGYKDIGRQFSGKNLEACMSLSGGVDSRTCLAAIYRHATINAINHGGKDYYESLRAKDVADAYKLPIYIASTAGKMFLPKEKLDKYFLHDGGVVVEYDPIKDEAIKHQLPPLLVLGDLFETFKVDGTSVWDGRAKKKSTTLKLMFGSKINFETLEEYGFEKWVAEKADYFMEKLIQNEYLLSDKMATLFKDKSIKAEIKNDFIDWLSDFKNYGLKYVEDLNEVAYWLSKGRTAMWLQSSSSSGFSAGFTLFCTDQNLASILSVPIKYKLRQKLHFYMFRLPDFKEIRKIPTPQIPFTPVSAALPVKELVMYLRLILDRIIAKSAAKNEFPDKTRLLKSANYKQEYNNENLKIIREWYNDVCVSHGKIIQLFKDMQSGTLGSFSSMSYIGLAKAEFVVSKCKAMIKNE